MCGDVFTIDTGDKFNNLQCVDRKCSQCGTHKITTFLKPLLDVHQNDLSAWQKWGKSHYKGKPKKALLKLNGTIADLVDELTTELQTFTAHLFTAKWQQVQFSQLIRSPPEKSFILVMDFSENYTCFSQNEVQSAHWSQNQVTLHPMVAFYDCDSCEAPHSTVREAIHIISNDISHDAHSVCTFTKAATAFLLHNRGLHVNREIQWSDGCGCQYKSRTPLMDISHAATDLNISAVERNYFGSRHGKNPCDGEGGVVKSAVTRAVKAEDGMIIQDAESFHRFCQHRLAKASKNEDGSCNHSRRVFILLDTNEINRNRPERVNVKTLDGTRKLHSVVGLGSDKVKVRRLSCYCAGCEQSLPCLNAKYTTPWANKKIKREKVKSQRSNKHSKSKTLILFQILYCT